MKRKTHKIRKRSKRGKKQTHTDTHTHKNKKTYNPKKKKDNRKNKKTKKEKGMMKENQKQRHQPKKTNTTNKNTEKLTRTMIKTQVLIAQEKFNHKNDSKGPVVKKGNSKKYQTIVLVFLKVNGKGRRMQRQIYRDRFVAVTKIAYFGPLGGKIAFCGIASLALRFQWFQRNFVDFGNTVFCKNEARHQKTQK